MKIYFKNSKARKQFSYFYVKIFTPNRCEGGEGGSDLVPVDVSET